jgi:rifampicin phosphotransferase
MEKYFCNVDDFEKGILSTKNLGGKGYNLLKLYKAGKNVPVFLLLPTEAFQFFLKQKMDNQTMEQFLLNKLQMISEKSTLNEIREIGQDLRTTIEEYNFKDQFFIKEFEEKFKLLMKNVKGVDVSFAVRSSATDEDLGDFSFAGQHDTYLNIKPDSEELLKMIKKCWASIFSDRALIYRQKNMLHSMKTIPLMCVVVQQMVKNVKYAGIVFTSDPLNSNRRMITIDASYGLGEALVSGLVTADSYRVNKLDLEIKKKTISKKLKRIVAKDGTTIEEDVPKDLQEKQALSDDLIVQLAKYANRIEEVYESQQDIEYAIDEEHEIFILQSRPITSLIEVPHKLTPFYETPEKFDVTKEHGYVSMNHIQVMTDPFKPFGVSALQKIMEIPCEIFSSSQVPDSFSRLTVSEGRIYADMTDALSTFPSLLGSFLGSMDQKIESSIREFSNRKDFKSKNSSISFFKILMFLFVIIKFFFG